MTAATAWVDAGWLKLPHLLPGLPRLLWWLLFFSVVPLALIAFVSHLEQADIPTLVQGPLVVDPTLGDRLATVLPVDFIRWSQLGIHVAGFAFFAGLASLIALRSQETVSLVASAMLVTVGASLFAPLAGLQGLPGRLAEVVGEMAPGRTAGMWISISGILLDRRSFWSPPGAVWAGSPVAVLVTLGGCWAGVDDQPWLVARSDASGLAVEGRSGLPVFRQPHWSRHGGGCAVSRRTVVARSDRS